MSKHYLPRQKNPKCSVDGCTGIYEAKGLCKRHYVNIHRKKWRHKKRLSKTYKGNPRPPKKRYKLYKSRDKVYSDYWPETRKEIYKRDNWTCQIPECNKKCHGNGNKDKIQCHHIDYNIKNSNNDNLVTLCASCHAKTNFNKEHWLQYFKERIRYMEWKLVAEQKTQYDNLLKSAQDLEANIGASQYRMHKLMLMREDIDKALKTWWDQVLKDLSLDPKKDYMITREGDIKDVTREAPVPQPVTVDAPSLEGTNAAELK